MSWRKAAFAALLAVLVGVSVLPLAAQPLIREFPKPFVQDGTIDYDGDGVPDIAIIIGGQKPGVAAAAEDVRGAALIGVKIGSHLYYSKAPNTKGTDYFIEELTADAWALNYKHWGWAGDAADEGFWFEFGLGVYSPPFSVSYPDQYAFPLDDVTDNPDYLLVVSDYYNETVEAVPICPACPNLGVLTCEAPVLVYSVGYKLTADDFDILEPGVLFADHDGTAWIVDGYTDPDAGFMDTVSIVYNDNTFYGLVSDVDVEAEDIYTGATYSYSLNKPGFALIYSTTPVGTAIFEEGKEYYIPFLGYWIEIDDITDTDASFIVRESEGGPVRTMLNLEYTTDAQGNVNKLFIYHDDLAANRLTGAGYNMVFFLYLYRVDTDDDYIEVTISSPWIDKHVFERMDLDGDGVLDITDLENAWPADVPVTTFDWWIEDGYFVGYVIIDGADDGPFSVKMDPWDKLPYEHIYGIVSYSFPDGQGGYTDPVWYVVAENGTWHLGEKKTYGGLTFIFDNLEVFVHLDGTPAIGDGEAICGKADCWEWDDFGVFLYEEGEELIREEYCEYYTDLTYLSIETPWDPPRLTAQALVDSTYDVDAVALYEQYDIHPINVTGVFAGVYDRFENVTGNWTGTTLLDEYNRDITPASEKDQIFELEDVFSFVKAPLVWTDYQFLDENYEVINPELADKNLILIGGPVVNRAVDYLNDTGLLWIVYVGDRLYDMRFYHDGIYEDEGYVDLERIRTWIGAHTVSFIGGLGVIQYAKEDPWGEEENYILVVAGNNRYGTYAAAVALADPTKIVRVPKDIPEAYYLAGTDEEHPPALIVVALLPGVAPPAPWVPPEHDNIIEITWPTPVTVEPVVSPGG